ncbi:unnamed protein product [Schistosoma curassoni]|uniref:Phage protein n=1 Tax=Schistosoma curassoni TaxID=6186 RepID=A0A183KCZ5_9TREM|nr:unnamed protein product [Schistosoma curassoni]
MKYNYQADVLGHLVNTMLNENGYLLNPWVIVTKYFPNVNHSNAYEQDHWHRHYHYYLVY